jgi:hypothetical protein
MWEEYLLKYKLIYLFSISFSLAIYNMFSKNTALLKYGTIELCNLFSYKNFYSTLVLIVSQVHTFSQYFCKTITS